jgi:deoxyribodipyrimidine photolyase
VRSNRITPERVFVLNPRDMACDDYVLYWMQQSQRAAGNHALEYALAINNKCFLDGRDANSFANIAWIFGQHDRPWGERPIFGKVRYMNARGLERKCDIKAYVAKVERLTSSLG